MPLIGSEDCTKAILGYEEMAEVGTMVGSGGCIFLNDQTCIVSFIWRTAQFYSRESCGKCTPCREGTLWLEQIFERIMRGNGQPGDKQLLLDICGQIDGRSLCALGDAAAWPVVGAIKVFPEEFDHYIEHGVSMVDTPMMREVAASPCSPRRSAACSRAAGSLDLSSPLIAGFWASSPAVATARSRSGSTSLVMDAPS